MTEPAVRGKYKKSERTRALIVQSCIDVLGDKGYSNTTVRDICAKAGVSIGAFYGHFKSKEELLGEIFVDADDRFSRFEAESRGKTCREKLLSFIQHYAWLNIGTDVEDLKVIMAFGNPLFSSSRPITEILLKIIREGQKNGEFITDIPAEEIQDMLLIFLRGCAYDWCMRNGAYDLERKTLAYADFLLSALYAPRKPGPD